MVYPHVTRTNTRQGASREILLRSFMLLGFLGVLLFLTERMNATPLHALKVADECSACHNSGRGQKPFFERRCSLDCQGCHIDPAGGGARNLWGVYYSQDQLPISSFFTPEDPLKDDSYFDVHYDGRIINRKMGEIDRTFPMSSEFTLRIRPIVRYLHITYSQLFMGRIGDETFRNVGGRRSQKKYALMIDNLPLNSYVRYGLGPPMYGIRRSNHTLWIRERIGLDQFAQTQTIEVGATPNVPFLRYGQILGDPNRHPVDQQKGTSVHGGLRGVTLGWHVNGSFWQTKSVKAEIRMNAFGFGFTPWDFLIYGERNFREVIEVKNSEIPKDASSALKLHPSSRIDEWTIAYQGIPGTTLGVLYEEYIAPQAASLRSSYFIDFHPVSNLQIEIWQRSEKGARTQNDMLAILHLYADL
jgi:hypothetical protein